MLGLAGFAAPWHRFIHTDPVLRVRHPADALVALARGRSVEVTARATGCYAKRIRVWRRRFLGEGRQNLAERPPSARPPALGADARALLEIALANAPLDAGYPVTVWTVVDLPDLLGRHGWPDASRLVARLRTEPQPPRADLALP